MISKIFKRRLWEGLTIGMASLMVVVMGGYEIASGSSAAINSALGISTSSISRSDDEEYQYFKSDYANGEYSALSAYYQSVAEQVEAEGIVLLKNDNNALPLSGGEKVSTMLAGSVNLSYVATGSSSTDTSSYTNLKDALEGAGFYVNSTMWNYYKTVTQRTSNLINDASYSSISSDAIASLDDYGTAIVVISRTTGEGSDIAAQTTTNIKGNVSAGDGQDGTYLSLNDNEASVLEGLSALKRNGTVKKIVVLLNSSATIQLDFLDKYSSIDACLWVGNLGSAGVNAVAKVLSGDYVPSGKLSDTYAKDNFSSPAAMQLSYNSGKTFSQSYGNNSGLTSTQSYYGVYSEGIYVGYRYYETRYTDYVTGRANTGDYDYSSDVAYSFGYGLSYTEFEYSDFVVTEGEDGESYDVTVTVTNSGSTYSGKEVAEVYLQKPYTQYDIDNGVEKSAVELAGYAKTDTLAPGESQTVTVNITKEQFKSYDSDGAETYIVDEGDYYLTVANGAHDAANNILAAQGYTTHNTDGRMDEDGNAALVSYVTVDEFDDTTYSVSSTGATVTNQLDDADLNKYEGSDTTVTYVSRNNWVGTMPAQSITVNATDKMKADLAKNKDIQEDSSAEMPSYGQDNGLNLAMMRGKDYDDEDWDKLLDQMTFAEQSELITNGYLTTVVVSSVGKPDTKEGDGPTGYSSSQGNLSLPCEGIWASTFNNDLIYTVGDVLAEECTYHGLTGLYAPGVNIHRMPFGGRSAEYFSEDPYLTGIAAANEIQGMQNKGVIAIVKHYAFNDQEASRNGISVWLNEQEAREIMLQPFEYALSSAEGMGNAHAVMTGFNRVGTDWCGAYSELINIMREEWGFDGYCITDAADSNGDYMTYQDGVPAGTDVYLKNGSSTDLDSFKSNATYCQAMRESCHRILYTVCNYSAAMNGISPDTSVGSKTEWWRTTLIAAEISTAVLTAGFGAMYVLSLAYERRKQAVE
ncbi:MAG: glycoside hydrolase family 3 C-terminal domain-containing protein [Clostridia bacterium]|nr:glycoside hydrolase family 3 C-terminal domain-containing protein [Clostridia bacterium]